MVGDWALAGRSTELEQIRALLAAGTRSGVVLVGAAGVGKTRLALECLDLAEGEGHITMRATATANHPEIPFAALAGLLPPIDQHQPRSPTSWFDLLRHCCAALSARGGGARPVILIDDAHLLDNASALLIHQVAATNSAFVLVTVRLGESAPDAVVGLWRDGLLARIELRGLPAETIEEILSKALGGPVDGPTLIQLFERCQGNMLFLRELVFGALADGSLQDVNGVWCQTGPLHPSERLVEIVEARLRTLSRAERKLLEVVSFGEPLGPAELTAMGDVELAPALERKGLLRSSINGRRLEVRLAHPIYGDVLRHQMPTTQATGIARALADAVEATGARRREDTLRVATWRLQGGGGSPEMMLVAAKEARSLFDFDLSEQLARSAIAAGAGFEARLLAAQLCEMQGRIGEAAAELTALASDARDDDQLGLVTISRLDNTAYRLGMADEAVRMAEDAEARFSDSAWRDEIAARRAGILLGTKGPAAAVKVAAPIAECGSGRAVAWACVELGYGLNRMGRTSEAIEAAGLGYAAHLGLSSDIGWFPWLHLYLQGLALLDGGELDQANALALQEYEKAVRQGSSEAQGFFDIVLGRVAIERGQVRTAARRLSEAAAQFHRVGQAQVRYFTLNYLALALALGNRPGHAHEILATLDGLGLQPNYYQGVDLHVARAWTAVAAGDLPAARKLFELAASDGDAIGDALGTSIGLYGLARTGMPRRAIERLRALADESENVMFRLRADHTEALVDRNAETLLRVAQRYWDRGMYLLGAEAAADAAVTWRRRGELRRAAEAEFLAMNWANECEGASTPALLALRSRAQLTAAEREVALLAAGGRSNKSIAAALSISVRTVENHLHRVYQKLSIAGRTELPNVIREREVRM